MSAAPEVSIVIPTRNRWPLLSTHGLPSALSQADVEFEVVIVDDASDDETSERLAELTDPRMRVVRLPERLGLAAVRNRGAAVARGAWIAFLDDDDLWSPHKLRRQLDTAARTSTEWVYARAIVVDAGKQVIDTHPFPDPQELETLLQGGNHVPGGGSNVIIRADLLHRSGGFDESLRYFEDWDMWLRLTSMGTAGACDDVLVARVEHGQNMLFRDRANVVGDFETLLAKHRPVRRRDRLVVAEWLAHEHVRAGFHRRAAALYLRAAVMHRSPGNLAPALGALFGRKGILVTSRLLLAVRGRTHLGEATDAIVAPAPAWLDDYR